MDDVELEVVKQDAVEFMEPVDDQLEAGKPISVEECEQETRELSIEELEAIFRELN
jgi:hypothetical protein